MKPQDKIAIDNLRMEGKSAGDIALILHLSPNTVRSHIRRHPDLPGTRRCRLAVYLWRNPRGVVKRSSARTNAVWRGGIPIPRQSIKKHTTRSYVRNAERSF